ncbi:MAG: 4Fe-4S dicluster domain-containing protein [Actinobacteria bacterium]|nr:4Fe-4S dicluster domain-containing protein [Actinomycetota bacterium]
MSIEITIDGKTCTCKPGEYIADIAARNDIYIPTLCGLHEALLGRGCCRICIVELIESGRTKVVASCIYPVKEPCEVLTRSERILRERGVIYTFLQRLAPDSELIIDMAKANGTAPVLETLEANEYGGKCILCGLCVEVCKILGTEAISMVGRGVEKKVSTPYDDESLTCIGCASCADVCPTGSISVQTEGDTQTIWGRQFSIVRCEVCGEKVGTEESLAYAAERAAETVRDEEAEWFGTFNASSQTLCSKHKNQKVALGLGGIRSAVI